jgi:leucyl aminopeptidase
MKIRVATGTWDSIECDALFVPLFEDEGFEQELPSELDKKLDGLLRELRETQEWTGKLGQLAVLYRPPGLHVARLVLLGAGRRAEYDSRVIRSLLMQAVRKVKSYNLKRVAVYRRSRIDSCQAGQAAVEGVILGTYDADEYKTSDRRKNFIEEILLANPGAGDERRLEEAVRRGEILGHATNLARTLVNEPGNRFNPALLAEKAKEIAEGVGLEIEVFDEREMQEKGMNAVLAVARGSDEPARFIVLKHLGAPETEGRAAVFIGKGVTFDSGGISLKPSLSMEEMKADKAGACAVLAAMQAVAQLQVKQNVIGIVPAVENLPSGRAQRPGDVIRSMSGKTIEVINTDAEGRLILADAIHYAKQFDPEYIVDIATLTGACVVALGHVRAGLFCNDEKVYGLLQRASEISGERFWRLPLDSDYRKEIESQIADIKNVGSRWGGAVTAAKFLQEFVGDVPWCHIDMAGVDVYQENQEGKGPTGFGVRTLVQMVLDESA